MTKSPCAHAKFFCSSVIALAITLLAPSLAHAHQSSVAYSRVEVSRELDKVTYKLRINSKDMAEPLGLDADTDASNEQIRAGVDKAFDYILQRIKVMPGTQTCPTRRGGVDILSQTDRFAVFTFTIECPKAFSKLVIEYSLFFDIDPLHNNNLLVEVHNQEPAIALLSDGNARFVWEDLGDPPPSGLWGFTLSGIDHIIYGFDHVAFVLALLLVAVLARGKEGGEWQVRGIGAAIKYTAVIVTSFTVGHSVTLISASMGWQPLSSKVVESLIALSIVYVAVENIVFPAAKHRFLIAGGFGLMHGLGFANMLRALLPPEHVVGPLLAFNVGVELGQLAIVVIVVPLLGLLAMRVTGAELYRTRVMPAASILVAAAGLIWLIERLFEVTILGI